MLTRSFFLCAALCGAAACVAPGASRTLQTPVTGEWTGTFDSSWGTFPIKATLANEPYSQMFRGTYALDGNRATGTIGGTLETKAEDIPGFLQGSLTISFVLADGQTCHSSGAASTGSATSRAFSLESSGFRIGNCPDPPEKIRITLRR